MPTAKYNKPFQLLDMEYINQSQTALNLKELVNELTLKGLHTTSSGSLAYSNLNEDVKYRYSLHPMRLWEYVRIIEICNLKEGMTVLDAGGASSPIVFYCAKKGINIYTVDLQKALIENSIKVAKQMGWGNLTSLVQDMTRKHFPDNYFDAIFSVSVFEHLPNEIKIEGIKEFYRILKPGGIVGLTFDFGKPISGRTGYDYEDHNQQHTTIRNIEEMRNIFIESYKFEVYGNTDFEDKVEPARDYIRACELADFRKNKKTLKGVTSLIRNYFNSPYFLYTFYSLFLKKDI